MYLIDTNVVSEFRKTVKGKGDTNVATWLTTVAATQFYTNPVVLMELERGILALAYKDPLQSELLQRWYQSVVQPLFAERVLPIDAATASICASLHLPDRSPANDTWIAASALQYGLTLVTRNVKDFRHPDLRLLNPFAEIPS